MTTYTNNCIKGKFKEEVLVFTARERVRKVPCHLKERPKGNFKDDLNNIKKLLKYIIKETIATNEIVTDDYKSLQNSVMSMREDIKDCIESIKLKRNESDSNSESGPVPEVVSSSPKPDQSDGNKTEDVVVCRDAEGNSRERETDGNVLQESEDTENVINAHDKGTHEDLNTDHDLQGKHNSLNEAVNMDVEETGRVSNSVNQVTMLQEKENMLEEVKAKLEESQKAFKELKEEMVAYRTESQTNERILTEELDIMRSELRELRTNNYKLLSQAEYNEKRLKFLSDNTYIYKLQITALEEKNKTYNLTIVKHEQTIMHLK
jgi:hypothetical protein